MTAPLAPAAIATSITDAWSAFLERDTRPSQPRPYVWASSWRVCLRRMVFDMTKPEEQPRPDAELLAKFRRGNDRERDLLVDLMRIGRDAKPPFGVVGQQQRFELRDHKSRVAVVGKVDAQLHWQQDGAFVVAPIEVKAWSPFLVDQIETFDDLFTSPWTRAGAYQLLCYLFGAAVPFGFLLLDRSGLPLLLPVELDAHLDRLEEFLTRAEQAIDHRVAGTLPDYLVGQPGECQRCPYYGTACQPPLTSVGTTVLTDPQLVKLLDRREQLAAGAKEFDRIDRDVKERLRGVEHGVAGTFVIEGRWGKQSRVELPENLKKQYTTVDPRGRFTLEITRVGDGKAVA